MKQLGEAGKGSQIVNDLILSVETAIATGSLSLSVNEDELDRAVGTGQLTRAESMLSEISDFLNRNDVGPGDLTRIAVSLGPGSYTGIKIGIATTSGAR